MREGKAVYLVGDPNVEALGGMLCCFLVTCPDHQRKAEVDGEIRSNFHRMGLSDMSSEEHSIFGMPFENLVEADRALERLKSIRGVQSAGMHIMKEVIVVRDWMKSEIEKRISAQ